MALDTNAIKALNSNVILFPTSAGWQRSLSQDDPGKNHRIYRILVDRIKSFDEYAWGEPLSVLATVSGYIIPLSVNV